MTTDPFSGEEFLFLKRLCERTPQLRRLLREAVHQVFIAEMEESQREEGLQHPSGLGPMTRRVIELLRESSEMRAASETWLTFQGSPARLPTPLFGTSSDEQDEQVERELTPLDRMTDDEVLNWVKGDDHDKVPE